MKKSYSISFIFSAILLLVFLLFVLPLSYFSLNSFEKSLHGNIGSYLKQVENSSRILLEQERFVLNNLSLELATIIANLKSDNFDNISLDNDTAYNEIDLFFIQKGDEVINNSTSLFDSDEMIQKLLPQYKNNSHCVYKVTSGGEIFAVILSSHRIINTQTGRVEGTVYVGKVLNDNLALLTFIKESVALKGVSFYVDDALIASTYQKSDIHYKKSEKLGNKRKENLLHEKNFLYSKIELDCHTRDSGIYMLPVLDATKFNELKENFDKQILILVMIFALIGLFIYVLINRFVIAPMNELLSFAKEVKEKKSKKYESTVISEYNTLGEGLEDIISQLRDVKEQYSLAIDGTQEGLWDWNIKENTIYFSKRCKEMLGFAPDEIELTVESWSQRIHPNDKANVDKRLIGHLKQELPNFEGEFRIMCKDGDFKWLRVRAKALFENGKAYRMVGFHSDIDPIKKLEEDNRQKEAYILEQSKMTAMGDMLSNIAHQWRQPLSAITTIVSGIKVTLELDLFDKDDIIRDLDTVGHTSQKLSRTIDTFRETYNFGHKKEDFNIKDIIINDIDILKPAFLSENIEFIVDVVDVEYYGYKDELLLIMNKVIQNAKDAIKNSNIKNGLIFIKLDANRENINLNIYDNGLGVADDIKSKIFEPYFTTKHKSQGVGLSLYMAKNILTKYFSGDLRFTNKEFTYENTAYQGTQFTISFPVRNH